MAKKLKVRLRGRMRYKWNKRDGLCDENGNSKAMLGNAKSSIVHFLLRFLRHHLGMVIDQGRRKYIVDNHGAWRRLGRDA